MKRSLIMLNSLLMGLVLAVYGSSFAFDFPITFTGTYHLKQEFTNQNGTGICESDVALTIILYADGNLAYTYDLVSISTHDSSGQPRSCNIIPKGEIRSINGTHDGNGKFTVPFDPSGTYGIPPLTGSYDENHIKASWLWAWTGGQQTIIFDLPNTNQPPKITLEPATYPEFQMNILEKKGFTIKIRKEDGVMDSQGNWKLNWPSLLFATDGADNTEHFLKKFAEQVICSISDDKKEALIKIIPDPKKFMLEQNMFNILLNGEHKIGFQICDTDGRCGSSAYTVYFGPFVFVGSVMDQRCTEERKEQLDIGRLALGNMGYASPLTGLYLALINVDNPNEYWCIFEGMAGDGWFDYFWSEGYVTAIADGFFLPEATFLTADHFPLNLHFSVPSGSITHQPFPAGDYRFLALIVDYYSGATKGDSKNVTTCK